MELLVRMLKKNLFAHRYLVLVCALTEKAQKDEKICLSTILFVKSKHQFSFTNLPIFS